MSSSKPLELNKLRLVHLQQPGVLQRGDKVEMAEYGLCTVALIHSPESIRIRTASGQHVDLNQLGGIPDLKLQ